MTSTLTILKKIDIQNDIVSFKNNSFKQVTFWGRVVRVLLFFACKDGFKDCYPNFITKKMVVNFNKECSLLSREDQQKVHRKIVLYAKQHHTQIYIAHLVNPKVSNSANRRDKELKGSGCSSNLSETSSLRSSSDVLSVSSKKMLDWSEVLKDYHSKNLTANNLVDYVKNYNLCNLSAEQAVKIYSITSLYSNGRLEIDDFKKMHRSALIVYTMRKATRQLIGVENSSWQQIIKSMDIPNDTFSVEFLRSIVNKDPSSLTPQEALVIFEKITGDDKELAQQFAAKLAPFQIKEIVKKYATDTSLSIEDFIDGEALYKLCTLEYDRTFLLALLNIYSFQLDECILLPESLQAIWNDLFLEVDLEDDELLIIAKKMINNASFSLSNMQHLKMQSKTRDQYSKNMEMLRALASKIDVNAKETALYKDLIAYIIPLLDAIEPKNSVNLN